MIKFLISIIVIIMCLITMVFIQSKYKLTRKQIAIFMLLVLFWISVGLIRDYRKRYAIIELAKGGLGLSPLIAANIAAGYGLVSMFVRLPIFFLSDLIKKRKLFVQIALLLLIISGVFVVTNPNATTLYYSSLAMGFAASLLALFNVVFASTFSKEKAMVSISILSIAPLLAEFISSSMQYFIFKDQQNYPLLWICSVVFAALAFLMTLIMDEFSDDGKQFTKQHLRQILTNKTFLSVCIISIIISLIRFSTSGANLNAYVKLLNMDEFYISYIDVVFSIAQLIAGVLMGLYIQKKLGSTKTLLIGLSCSLLYIMLLVISQNQYLLFYSYVLHGFGYGICYNCLLGLALEPFDKSLRYVSMGIFQAFFAIGIYFGDKIYAILFQLFPQGIFQFNQNQTLFLIMMGLIVISGIIISIINFDKTYS